MELITDATKLEPMIAEAEEQLFILKNDRDDRLIQSKRGEKALTRRSQAILDATTKRDTAQAIAATLPDGPQKDKQLGIVETQKARLFNLNRPVESGSAEDLIETEIEKEEQEARIAFYQDVLDNLNARKTEILAG
ncbi:MAG TPA: hypothetical protein PKY12_10180 [Catalimonadaceae bacterium]|nr:hypothetical protein [Catalimonadaceae bacterium]